MNDIPREGLYRMTDFDAGRILVRDDGDLPILAGYPIVYNKWAEIHGWEGHFLERISPGAPDRHLKTHRDKVKVLFNHGFDITGRMPLGKPTVIESKKRGLYTETPLDPTSYNEDLRISIESGAIDGMSFQFSVSREEWRDEPDVSKANPKALPERTISELKMFEFGPVTFPAYEATSVGIRGQQAYQDRKVSIAEHGTLTLASDGFSVTNTGALAFGHPSASDVARLQRAVTRSLKEHTHAEGTTRPTR